jgi:hypothetical protein
MACRMAELAFSFTKLGRSLGQDEEGVFIDDDFDAPLPDELLADFER